MEWRLRAEAPAETNLNGREHSYWHARRSDASFDAWGVQMAIVRVGLAAAFSLIIAACGSTESAPVEQINEPELAPSPAEAPIQTPTPPAESPNYAEKDGDAYLYITAVTEEDQKKGKAVGDVVMFRYRGVRDGMHVLESISENGHVFSTAECAEPCRIIKRRFGGTTDRLPYEPNSIIGSAFEDAINHRLQPARGETQKKAAPDEDVIPAAFRGSWNEKLVDCGTGLNDTKLEVEARRVRFYESDADVRRVTVENARTVTVVASFAGEGQTWNDSVSMVLSRSGNDLTIDGFTRHRCPNSS